MNHRILPFKLKMTLKEYNRKRNFDTTTEPPGELTSTAGALRFVIQMHDATRLHFDFRIEMDGTFKSWAVPKGPSLNPNDQRLAVFVEDHPIEYGGFEGIIPKGNYGAGTVMIWDAGTFHERTSSTPEESIPKLLAGLEKGHITIVLSGRKIAGEFAFIKLKDGGDPKAWLLVKKRDEFASYSIDVLEENTSVASGRTIRQIADAAAGENAVWLPGTGAKDPAKLNDMLYYTGTRRQADKSKKASAPVNIIPATLTAIDDAPVERLPRKNKPMLPQLGAKIFQDPDWTFELHWAGHRALAEIENSRVSLYSRQGIDYRKRYPDIVSALALIPGSAILDGDIVIADENGKPDPELLKHYSRDKVGTPMYLINDVLHLNGKNTRDLPHELRQQLLSQMVFAAGCLKQVVCRTGDSAAVENEATAIGCPGLLARHRKASYSSGTNSSWLRIDLDQDEKPRGPQITNPEKIYWPEERISKGDVIAYYEEMAAYILPYLKDRPQSLNRHPNGINGESFFQKDMVGYLPGFVTSHTVFSQSSAKSINYLLCQNKETLLYLANLGCIELNPWLSRTDNLELPDYSVIDLDPDDNDFNEVVTVALAVKRILDEVGVESWVKTSGSTGLHILVHTGGRFTYETNRIFAEEVCRIVNKQLPKITSIERSPAKRRGKIYLDFMQNRRGQTLASVYCLRPKPGATASTPLHWQEVRPGLSPAIFTIKTMAERLSNEGDLWSGIFTRSVDIEPLIEKIRLLPV